MRICYWSSEISVGLYVQLGRAVLASAKGMLDFRSYSRFPPAATGLKGKGLCSRPQNSALDALAAVDEKSCCEREEELQQTRNFFCSHE
jgi:hypothetical protein